jgi:hypothetical protein
MKYLRLYTGKDGESHFEDCELPYQSFPPNMTTEPQKTKDVRFLDINGYHDYHNAPQRQFVIFLDRDVEIEVADGSKRTIKAGEVLLAEDTTGHGHITRSVDGERVKAVFIVLD